MALQPGELGGVMTAKLLKVRALLAIGSQNAALALLILLALSAGYRPAVAQPLTQVIVFGDSNVDSGYFKALSNPGSTPTYNALWPSALAHGAAAPTTNPAPVKSQMLAAYFGLTANPSNTASGTNYATSGAKNVTVNNTQTGGFTAAIPTVTQISNYLAANSGAADSKALYLIYSGDSDIKYALGQSGAGPYPMDPNAYVTTAADSLATAIANLNTAGAKRIIVSGLAYDFPGGPANATERALKLLYTNTLWNQLTALSVPFFRGDIDSVRLAIAANPARYGFTSITNTPGTVACTQPSGVATAWALLCSSDPAAPSTWVSPTAPQTDLFADDDQLATAGQRLMARYFRNLVLPPTATHDYNGDGKSDIIWRDTISGATAAWMMNGGQVLSSGGFGIVPNAWSIVGQRDFNGDGKYDLLWRDTSGNTVIWFLNGATVTSTGSLGNIPNNWKVVATGDFDGDGKGDILWQDTSGNLAMWLMNGTAVTSSARGGRSCRRC
jgi:phospholipase/lecithinase/hemolysin